MSMPIPRIVSVDENFALAAGTKVLDSHLPTRLQDEALSATIVTTLTDEISVVKSDGTAAPWRPGTPATSTPDLAFWGHSLVYSSGGTIESRVASQLGVAAANGGVGGQTSTDIAFRMRGLALLLTLSGNQIPAGTTDVAVTAIQPGIGEFRKDGGGLYNFAGYFQGHADVPGTLTQTISSATPGTGTTWKFRRTTAGSAITIAPGTPFISLEPIYPTRTSVFLPARNDFYSLDGFNLARSLRNLKSMVAALTPAAADFLVLSEMVARDEKIGATGSAATRRTQILADNAQRLATWPSNYYDILSDYIAFGLALAGTTPSATDRTDIAAAAPANSIMQDLIHPNVTGYTVMGTLIAAWFARNRGYALAGGALPGTPTALSAPDAAGTDIAVSWTAPAGGAASYVVQYKLTTDTDWKTWPDWTAGTSLTITGLAVGSYMIRVAAVNSNGPSLWSSAVTANLSITIVHLASDSFNRADGALVGSTTDSAYGGTVKTWAGGVTDGIRIVSNQIGKTAAAGFTTATVDLASDVAFSFRINALPTTGSILNVWGRRSDSSNYNRLRIGGDGYMALGRTVAGTANTVVDITGGPLVAGDKVVYSLKGTAIKVTVNGAVRYTGTDPSIMPGTLWGMEIGAESGTRLDEFDFTEPV
jgi:hypothetical protein